MSLAGLRKPLLESLPLIGTFGERLHTSQLPSYWYLWSHQNSLYENITTREDWCSSGNYAFHKYI